MSYFTNRVISITHKKTTMRLTDIEWEAFSLICQREKIKKNYLLEQINTYKNPQMNLTSSVRLFTTIYLFKLSTEKKEPQYMSSRLKPVKAIFAAIHSII